VITAVLLTLSHIIPTVLPAVTALFLALMHIIHAVIPPITHVIKLVVPVVAISSHLESLGESCGCKQKTY
jgi:phage-related protein